MWDAFPGMARLISILLSVTASSEGEEQSLKGKSHSKKQHHDG